MIAGTCSICGAPTVNTCSLCGMPVCSAHYDRRSRMCSTCSGGRQRPGGLT